jgi:phosphatidylinositol glycan class B
MLLTILWTISVYSFAGHKEWRFLHPILPLFHVFAAKSLVDLVSDPSRPQKRGPNQIPRSKHEPQVQPFIQRYFLLPDIPRRHLTLLLATLPVSTYVVLFYCSAPISVFSFLRSIPRTELNSTTVGILMPCHSTPGQAFLHREELANGRMWALGCEPPLE